MSAAKLTLNFIAEALGVPAFHEDKCLSGVSIDTRALLEDDLFVAIKGEQSDGHDHISDAIEQGAAAAIVSHDYFQSHRNECIALFPVEDTVTGLQKLAAKFRDQFKGSVFCITGTNGKTTTKEMISSVLGKKYHVHCTSGNLNNHLGVPLTVLNCFDSAEIMVIEMGANHPGDIAQLCEIAKPTHGMITNIGKGHLAFFKDEQTVARSKSEILTFLKQDGTAFLNGDDPLLHAYIKTVPETITYGMSPSNLFRAAYQSDMDGCYTITRPEGTIPLQIPGRHNAMNALAAACAGQYFKVPWEDIQETLSHFQAYEKRMEIVKADGILWLMDCYNANPTSMRAALTTLADMTLQSNRRSIAVLGDMLELGNLSVPEHQQLGESLSQLGIQKLYALGDAMQQTVAAALASGFKNAVHYTQKSDLARELNADLKQGDVVLMKASRGMRLETIAQDVQQSFRQNSHNSTEA